MRPSRRSGRLTAMTLPPTFALPTVVAASLARVCDGDAPWDQELGGYRYPVEELSVEELERIQRAGVVPNHRVAVDHDEAVARLRGLVETIAVEHIGSAFVAAFSAGSDFERLAGGMMNWVQAAHMPAHAHQGNERRPDICGICGHDDTATQDLGEVAHRARDGAGVPASLSDPTTLIARLEVFVAAPIPRPDDEARGAFRRLFEVLEAASDGDSEGKIRRALGKVRLLANARQRATVLETLGTAGVLCTPEHPGFFRRHFEYWGRQQRPRPRVDADPPICFWRARHGVNAAAVHHYFGHLGLDLPLRAPAARASAATKTKRATPATELEVGDVFAFPFGDGVQVGVVTGFVSSKSAGPGPVFAFYSWEGDEPPDLEALSDLEFHPARYAIFRMRKRVHRKTNPLYRHVGRIAEPPARESGCTIARITDLDRILRHVVGA